MTSPRWCLMVFDAQGKRLLAPLMLTDEQAAALRPYLGAVEADGDHYPVVNVRLLAGERTGLPPTDGDAA